MILHCFLLEETRMRKCPISYFCERLSFIKGKKFIIVVEYTRAHNNLIYFCIFVDISLVFELAGLGSDDQKVFD